MGIGLVGWRGGIFSRTEALKFRRWLADAEQGASDLEKRLRRLPGKEAESETEQMFGKLGASCSRCHAKYRDVPQDR
jgi:cytochrome c556